MAYLTSLQLVPVIGHIDLFSLPFENTHLLYLDLKSTPTHGNCIPSPPTCGKHGWKIPCISMSWRLLIDLREYMCMTNPLNIPYMEENGHLRVKIPYMEENGHLRVKDGHLTLLVWLPYCPRSGLRFERSNIKSIVSLFGNVYISKLIKKEMEKTCGIRWKLCLLWAQVSNFTFLLRLAITLYYF